jgi:putative DNA primase/helicase
MTVAAPDFSVLGATRAQWNHWRNELGLARDLLPVVADTSATIAGYSDLEKDDLGRVPSNFDTGREVYGIGKWTQRHASSADIREWSADPRLGICVQSRTLRAIDVDLTDEAQAQKVFHLISTFLYLEELNADPPRRGRPNSSKFLVPVWVEGARRKCTVKCSENSKEKIEFLADGQQFVAVSTHPSGVRYTWMGSGLVDVDGEAMPTKAGIPTLTPDQYDFLIEMLAREMGVEGAGSGAGQRGAAPRTATDDFSRAIKDAQVSDQTIEDVRAALQFLAAEADDYDSWIRVGLALKGLEQAGWPGEARELWHEFSKRSAKYDFDEAEGKWSSFDPTTITYKTIFELAQTRGWVNPRSAEAIAQVQTTSGGATRVDRTDAGNMALLAELTMGNLRYVPERRAWLLWDGQRWVVDEHGVAAQGAALRVAEHYHQQVVEMGERAKADGLDDKERKHLEQVAESIKKWATQCRSKRSIDNMLALAKSDLRFTLSVLLLDKDPWLLGVENGVVDLRTGLLRDAAREDYVTRRATVSYDPDAKAPRWTSFIGEVTGRPDGRGGYTPRPELASYLQLGLGYGLTGTTGEQKMFMAVGEGSNGKNVLLDTLQSIMGDYCVTVPPEALMAVRGDGDAERPSPVAATLAGARLAISSESKDGQRLDVALVKRHTGGGYMTARFMRENSFRFEITHKLWLMTNHRPALDHLDDAMRGRLHLIPFDMRWNRPGHPAPDPALPDGDKGLLATLRAEAPGILAWLVRGAVAYSQRGLEPPA